MFVGFPSYDFLPQAMHFVQPGSEHKGKCQKLIWDLRILERTPGKAAHPAALGTEPVSCGITPQKT